MAPGYPLGPVLGYPGSGPKENEGKRRKKTPNPMFLCFFAVPRKAKIMKKRFWLSLSVAAPCRTDIAANDTLWSKSHIALCLQLPVHVPLTSSWLHTPNA